MTDAPRGRRPVPRLALLLALPVLLAAAAPVWYPRYARFHPLRPSFASGVAAARALVACARGARGAEGAAAPALPQSCHADTRGWRVSYAPDAARPGAFRIVVRERVAPFAAYRSLAADEDGTLRVAERRGDAREGDPYLTGVPAELARIRACIREIVARRPGREVPGSLAELGARGEGCAVLDAAQWSGDSAAILELRFAAGESAVTERYRIAYSVRYDTARAWYPRVDARPTRYPADGVRSYALIADSLHATADDRAATESDPPAERCEELVADDCPRLDGASWLRPAAARGGGAGGPVLPPRDSAIAWSAPLGIPPRDGVPARLAAPAVGPDGGAYAASPAGVYSFLVNGARRWARPTLGVVEEGGVAVIAGQVLAPTRDSGLVALDPVSGETRWRSSALPGLLAFHPVALPGGAIAAVNRTGALAVFEPDGRVRWSRRLGSSFYSAPVADAAGTLYAVVDGRETELVVIDAHGKERRRTRVGGWRTPPVIMPDGTILVASGAGLFAVERSGGSPRKLAASAADADQLLPRADGSVVYSDDRRLVAIAPNGVPLWSYRPSPPPSLLAGPAALADGSIVFADATTLRALGTTGDSLWTVPLGPTAIVSTPVVGPDGTIYVTDSRWRITAVRR